MTCSQRFLQRSVHHLREEYLGRIGRALNVLPEEDLWWRPHDGCTSVGNLLMHLEGNVRQWIVSGLGGESDDRRRRLEFETRSGPMAQELFERLDRTVREACGILENFDESRLSEMHHIQDYHLDSLAAIYHVVEHFSWHTGQITWIAKARAGEDHELHYYDDARLNEAPSQLPPAGEDP